MTRHGPTTGAVVAVCALMAWLLWCVHSENLAKIAAAERVATAYAECLP